MRKKVAIRPLFSDNVLELVEREAAEVESEVPNGLVSEEGQLPPGVIADDGISYFGHTLARERQDGRRVIMMAFALTMVVAIGFLGDAFTVIQLVSLAPAFYISCLVPLGLDKEARFEERLKIASIAHVGLGIAGFLQLLANGPDGFKCLVYLTTALAATVIVVMAVSGIGSKEIRGCDRSTKWEEDEA